MTASVVRLETVEGTREELYDEWWNEPGMGDESMESDHNEHWDDFIAEMTETSLEGRTVLDFGCNRGGMLRVLYDTRPFEFGVGVDLARRSIAAAERNKGNRPIRYEASANLRHPTGSFDIAMSSAVIYLIDDLQKHAEQIFRALKPGGVYYASHPDYASYPNREEMRQLINRYAEIPMQNHTLDDVVRAFSEAGFQVGLKRMVPRGYMNVTKPGQWYTSTNDQIVAHYHHRYMFRCVKPVK